MTDRHDPATFGLHSVLPGPESRPSPGRPTSWPRSSVEETMSRGRSLFIAAGAAGLLMVTFAVAGLIFAACSSAPTPAPSTVASAAPPATVSVPPSTAPSAAPPATVSVPPSTAPSAAPPAPSSVAPGVGAVGANSQLGKAIFFDKNLSLNRNLSCSSCHDAAVGFTGPLSKINLHGAVYEGSIAGAFGNSKPPSSCLLYTSDA